MTEKKSKGSLRRRWSTAVPAAARLLSVALSLTLLTNCSSSSDSDDRTSSPTPARTATPISTGTAKPTDRPTPSATPTSSVETGATDLAIGKTARGTFTVGDEGTYALEVTNLGPRDARGTIVVVDTLPGGLSLERFVSADWTCANNGAVVECASTESLAVGETSSLLLVVDVDESAFPSVTNSATLSYAQDLNPGNNTVDLPTDILIPPTEPPPGGATDIGITKFTLSTFTVGDEAIYSLEVTNFGPRDTDDGITVIDSLPTGLDLVEAVGPDWACSPSGSRIDCVTTEILSVGVTSTIFLVVDVKDQAFPTVTNESRVFYSRDTDPTNNFGPRPTTIRPRP